MDQKDKSLGVPEEPHIPRPLGNDEDNYDEVKDGSDCGWSNDINFSFSGLNLDAGDADEFFSKISEAKRNLENVLKMAKDKQKVKKPSVYYDLSFPVPDTTIPKDPKLENKVMNEWSVERAKLLTELDENAVEMGRQYTIIGAKKQENEELSNELTKIKAQNKLLTLRLNLEKSKTDFFTEKFEQFSKLNPETVINGDKYWGNTTKEGKQSGLGLLQMEDGNSYLGGFSDGLKNGYGLLKTKHNMTYNGFWLDGIYDGLGKLSEDGKVYEGSFLKGLRDGFGREVYDRRDCGIIKYEGEWKDGARCGEGKMWFDDDSVYCGSLMGGYPCGYGKVTRWDGSCYKGQWKDGMEHGDGEYQAPDGEHYEGQWLAGKMDGKGVFTHTEGWQYKGDFARGKKEGWGELKYQNSLYSGEWKDDCRHGQGEYTFFNDARLKGEWKANLADGQAVFEFPDGGKYDGSFKAGWPCGQGVFVFPDGTRVEREWNEHLPTGYRVEIPWQKTMYRH